MLSEKSRVNVENWKNLVKKTINMGQLFLFVYFSTDLLFVLQHLVPYMPTLLLHADEFTEVS